MILRFEADESLADDEVSSRESLDSLYPESSSEEDSGRCCNDDKRADAGTIRQFLVDACHREVVTRRDTVDSLGAHMQQSDIGRRSDLA